MVAYCSRLLRNLSKSRAGSLHFFGRLHGGGCQPFSQKNNKMSIPIASERNMKRRTLNTRPSWDRPVAGQAESRLSDSIPALDGADSVEPAPQLHPFHNPQSTPPVFLIRSYRSPNATTPPSDAVQSTVFSSPYSNPDPAPGNRPARRQDDSQGLTVGADGAPLRPGFPTHPVPNARSIQWAGTARGNRAPLATTSTSTATVHSTAFSSPHFNLNRARRPFSCADPPPPPPIHAVGHHPQGPRINFPPQTSDFSAAANE
jgi:hypothetical protein